MNCIKYTDEASEIISNRTREICFPLHSVSTTTNVLTSVPLPCSHLPISSLQYMSQLVNIIDNQTYNKLMQIRYIVESFGTIYFFDLYTYSTI